MQSHRDIDRELDEMERELHGILSLYVAKSPKAEETARLIGRLQAEFDLLQPARPAMELHGMEQLHRTSLWKQCGLQLRTYGRSFWIAALCAFAMLTLSASGFGPVGFGVRDLYSVTVPLILLATVLYSCRTWNAEMRLLESITPYPPALLLLSRLLIVAGMNAVFGLAGTVYLALSVQHFPTMHFLLGWFSQVTFLTGLLAYVLFRKGIRFGFVAAAGGWGLWQGMQEWMFSSSAVSAPTFYLIELALLAAGCALFVRSYRSSLKLSWLKL